MTFCHATFGPMTMVSKLEVLSISTYKIVTIVNPLELISQRLMIRFDLTTKNHITDVWQSKISSRMSFYKLSMTGRQTGGQSER